MDRMTRREFMGFAGAGIAGVWLGGLGEGAEAGLGQESAGVFSEQIERVRKADATLRVLGADEKPLAGARVSIEQTGHEFLFGCAIPNPSGLRQRLESRQNADAFEKAFLRLFNYATTENAAKWVHVESEEGRYTFEDLDLIVDWCEQHGVRLKGHCLVWGTQGPQGVPDWLRAYEGERLRGKVRERVEMMVSRYAGRIAAWDVVNEPLHATWFEERLGPGYVAEAMGWAREAGPQATLLVNEFRGMQGEAPRYSDYLRGLRADAMPLDALGEQAHDHPRWYSDERIGDSLDTLARVGVPIHITEFTYPNDGRSIEEGPEGVWDEETQGRFYERCYRAFFAHPAVEAITMWALWDGSSWRPGGGILRPDFSPKPAFEALDRLINREWRTQAELVTDAEGRASFRGFFGRYQARVGEVGPACEFHLLRSGARQFEVRVRYAQV